ncbi:MAG TPA: hypothetical protein DDY13_08415 [Cytophagales bacterium]|jgi:hypothetical protein|nr:hypothetical protein [Cytophagales bacterium]
MIVIKANMELYSSQEMDPIKTETKTRQRRRLRRRKKRNICHYQDKSFEMKSGLLKNRDNKPSK